jgi:hypothetical protein
MMGNYVEFWERLWYMCSHKGGTAEVGGMDV